MGISNINKSSFDLYSKIRQLADNGKNGKKHNQQAKQLTDFRPSEAASATMDYAELSNYGKQKAREAKNETEDLASKYQELMAQLEAAREQGEAVAESAKTRLKCLLIAMRIMSGDEVPPEDYRYLAKNDLQLYAKAMMMRMESEKPKKHKRLSEDEDANAQGETSGSVNTASLPAANSEIKAAANADSAASQETFE